MAPACRALGVSRATAYRHRSPKAMRERPPRVRPALALSDEERAAVLAELHAERFVDRSPGPGVRHAPRRGHATSRRSARCTGSSPTGARAASDATSCAIPPTPGPSCSRRDRTSCGAGTSPSSRVPPPGPGSTSTSCSTSSAATCVGWLLAARESGVLADRLIAETVEKEGVTSGAHHPRRPGTLDDQQAGGAAARRSGHHEVPQPTPCQRRQPLQRGPVQDPQVPPGLPAPASARSRMPAPSAATFFAWYNGEHRHAASGS